jgi:RNA polymerase sigma-70 factor (ECF subfamily)
MTAETTLSAALLSLLAKLARILEPFGGPRALIDIMTAVPDQLRAEPSSTHESLTRAGPSAPPDFAGLVVLHQTHIWRYLRYLGADSTEAADLTQETFLAFARARFAERDGWQTAGYLRTVARNQLLALRRKQNRQVSTVDLESADNVWATAAGRSNDLTEYLDALRECVAQLDGRCRQAVDMHYRNGLGREAIAERLEMKPEGVKTLLRRVRQSLRECVERKLNRETTS